MIKLSQLIFICIFALPLYAFPILPVGPAPDCRQNSSQQTWNDLIQKVNWFGDHDPRRELSSMIPILKKLGFTKSDFDQLLNCTGYVICPANGSEPQEYGNGSVIGANGEIVTATHLFLSDPIHQKPRSNLSNCYFRNYANLDKHISIELTAKQIDNLPLTNTMVHTEADRIRVKLASPVPGCKHPIQADSTKDVIHPGREVVVVTTPTVDMNPRPSGHQPAVHICHFRDVDQRASGPSIYYSDCSSTRGNSAGLLMVQVETTEDGIRRKKWVPKAIISTSGFASKNGSEYDPKSDATTTSVEISDDF